MNDKINTNKSAVSEVEVTPSSKYIDWLLKNSINETDTPETTYRKIAEAVWAEATRKSAKPKASELIVNYAKSNGELLNRLYEARTVINNTLYKMTHGYAEEFNWAQSSNPIHIIGIFERNPAWHRSSWGQEFNDITSKIQNGTMKIKDNHIIKFSCNDKVASLEVRYLNNDPIALAQMVRQACRKNVKAIQSEKLVALNKEQIELNKKVAELQNRIASVQNEKPMKGKRVPKPKYVPVEV
jgi:hypothetical protein